MPGHPLSSGVVFLHMEAVRLEQSSPEVNLSASGLSLVVRA